MAPTKKPGKALVNWEEQFANEAKEASKGIEMPTAKWLSIKGGKLTYGGAEIPDNELRCVLLGYTYENQLYEGRYDPNNPGTPVCYAFGLDGKKFTDMAPHDKAPDPKSSSCAECPLNEYESDPKGGKGKACKNVVRLALIAESDLEDLDNAEVVYLKVPTLSMKNFNRYIADDLKKKLVRPMWSVITLLSVEPDEQASVKVQFTHAENIADNDLFQGLKDMFNLNMEEIGFPYVEIERPAPKAKGKAKAAPAGKFSKRR